jgi:hypothetical protein
MKFLRTKSALEHTVISAAYQLGGVHLQAFRIPGKNLFKWLKAMSTEFARLETALNEFVDGRIVTKYPTFVPEWEKAVGIPDEDFQGTGLVEGRRRHVVTKLAAEGVSTADELVWLCSFMGFVVTVTPGHYYWDNPDPRVVFSSEKESRFTFVFEADPIRSSPINEAQLFPVPFPWPFAYDDYNALQGFMLKVIPANCNALWIKPAKEGFRDIINDGVTAGFRSIINDGVTPGIKNIINE